MKKIKKFNRFIKENINLSEIPIENEKEKELNPNNFNELLNSIKKMVSETIGSDNEETIKGFIKIYIKNPKEKEIVGLINNSDIYEFYLKYMSNIDEILTFVNFYKETPKSLEIYSLYDYVVEGTKIAVLELLRKVV